MCVMRRAPHPRVGRGLCSSDTLRLQTLVSRTVNLSAGLSRGTPGVILQQRRQYGMCWSWTRCCSMAARGQMETQDAGSSKNHH